MSISVQQWLEVKKSTRDALAKIFQLKKSTFTHVVDHKVLSDGYSYEDLKGISLEEMKRITYLESDIYEEQFRLVVKMIEDQSTNVSNIETENDKTNGNPREKDQSATRKGSGHKQTEENNQGKDLPVSGRVEQVYNGSSELLPGSDDVSGTGVAKQEKKSNSKKS